MEEQSPTDQHRRVLKVERTRGALSRINHSAFSVDAFLREPLVARLATAGPVVRPVWFLWEEEAFWVLTGGWSRLSERLRKDSAFELVIDTCDIATGVTRQVIGRGRGSVVDFDIPRGRRKLVRYLGDDETRWDARFRLDDNPSARGVRWAKLVPDTLWISDLSFQPSLTHRSVTDDSASQQ